MTQDAGNRTLWLEKPKARENRLLWLDTETTGLDPDTNELLEVAMVLTDDAGNEIASTSEIIYTNKPRVEWENKAREFHEANGLIEEMESLGLTLGLAQERLVAFVEDAEADNCKIAGSGPERFDRPWMDKKMPKLASLFHYGSFDNGTLTRFFQLPKEPQEVQHRALVDLRRDIAAYRQCRGMLTMAQAAERFGIVGGDTIRRELLEMARCQEAKLRQHDGERGQSWKSASPAILFGDLGKQVARLSDCVFRMPSKRRSQEVVTSCVHAANYLMMIADRVSDGKFDQIEA